METIRQISSRYGPLGWILAISASAYLTGLLMVLVLGSQGYDPLFRQLAMPVQPVKFITQPWSLLSYWAVNHPSEILQQLVDLALMYSFGRILQREIGRRNFVWAMAAFVIAIAALTLLLVQVLPTVTNRADADLDGLQPVNAAILAMLMVVVPRLELRFFTVNVELRWIAGAILLLPLLGTKAIFTAEGVALLLGILLGAGLGWYAGRIGQQRKWDVRIRRQTSAAMVKDRVRIKETHSNPQHKGKFTIVHSTAKLPPEEELNRLLDRINEVGYNGLTSSEKKRLEELSGQ